MEGRLSLTCPPSKSLIKKIRERFRIQFSDYEYEKNWNSKNNFSQSFKHMVGLCLNQDPLKRPSAYQLLKHSFFKNCVNGSDFLVENVLQGLPTLEQRFPKTEDDRELLGECEDSNMGETEIILWTFNADSVVSVGSSQGQMFQVGAEVSEGREAVGHIGGGRGGEAEIGGRGGSLDGQVVIGNLLFLQNSLDEQTENVNNMIGLLRGEEGDQELRREEELMQVIENLMQELEDEQEKNFELEMELQILNLQLSNASD
ncbi:hypothetical protein F0562_007241 [Nyssa sinensis]|uniref:Protein kinase domain-containing protein n=1 Tax=Nyssa sinensis TaxID=561372 RepID=A0A5J5A7D2_9ASTE|nr:hypothetical protein F0562_007241 [Nyssa sinensis]